MPVYLDQSQDKVEFVKEHILPSWEEYCLHNWLSPNGDDSFSAESRVKSFLDSCAYLLLRDNPEGTQTLYKQRTVDKREVPISSCPAHVENILYGTSTDHHENAKRLKPDNVVQKDSGEQKSKSKPKCGNSPIRKMKRQFPDCTFSFCSVNTDNCFVFSGEKYKISEDLAAYRGVPTRYGMLYDMDRINVVLSNEQAHFFDQAGKRLAEHCVETCERKGPAAV